LIDVTRATPALAELHRWLAEHDFAGLERYPSPGHLGSLYHDPANLLRFVTRRSNSWQGSAVAGAYHFWLARSQPALWTLCRAFMLCEPVERLSLERELTLPRCERLCEAGILTVDNGCYVSLARATPLRGSIIWHDAPPGFRESWVFLGADSIEFARQLEEWALDRPPRGPRRYRRILDLCTGAGIHAIMLAPFGDEVVGTDINPRAIAFARFNASVNGVSGVAFHVSDLFDSVTADRFDLVVSNLPFLFLPDDMRSRCVDGDGGAMGIEPALRVVEGLSDMLAPGGRAILHANSPIVGGRDVLREELRARCEGRSWRIRLIATHEFQDSRFYGLYASHRIRRFVRYVIVLDAGHPFAIERRALPPWRKAACTVRIATVHLHGAARLRHTGSE